MAPAHAFKGCFFRGERCKLKLQPPQWCRSPADLPPARGTPPQAGTAPSPAPPSIVPMAPGTRRQQQGDTRSRLDVTRGRSSDRPCSSRAAPAACARAILQASPDIPRRGEEEEEEEGERNPPAALPGVWELLAAIGAARALLAGILAGIPAAPAEPQLPALFGRELGRAELVLKQKTNLPAGPSGFRSPGLHRSVTGPSPASAAPASLVMSLTPPGTALAAPRLPGVARGHGLSAQSGVPGDRD